MRPRFTILLALFAAVSTVLCEPLPIDPLWKSESFRKAVTGSFGIDSRIEPRITTDEEFYLDESAKAMADEDPEAAMAAFSESSLLEQSPIMLFSLATLQSQADETEAAVENFKKSLELFPNFRDAHRNLAVVYVQQGDYDEAEKHLVRAVELGSREGLTMGLLGYCHAMDDDHRAALDAYRLAVLTQPSDPQWQLGLAQALSALGKSRDAASVVHKLLKKSPADTQLWLLQADLWIALDENSTAIADLELVRRTGALNPNALVSLGHLYLGEDLPELAVGRYDEALTAENPVALPKAVEIVEYLVNRRLWKSAREVQAIVEKSEHYQPLLNSPETDTELLSRLRRSQALIELEDGDKAAGAKLVEDWLSREPTDGLAILLLARFRQEEGKREEAEMLLERAARDPEVAAAAHLAHGKLLVEEGEYEAAVEKLELAQQNDPKESVASYLDAVRELISP